MRKINLSIIMEKVLPEEGIKNFVKNKSQLVYASPKSKIRHNIPQLVARYGSGLPKFYFKTFLTMFSTIKYARKGYQDVSTNPMNPITKTTEKFIAELIEYAKSIGALELGFTKVEPEYIFKNSTILYENAIVVTMEMDKAAIGKAPSKITGHEVHRTYNELGLIVNKIAEFLRKRGYGAQANPALGGDVNYVRLAEKAGLGAMGTHGLLISPKVGPRQRIAAVFTSIENLPIKEVNEHLWIKSFCEKCKKCVRVCPSEAIYDKPQDDYNDTVKHIDCGKCAISFSNGYGCSVCIKECIFNNSDYEKIKKAFEKKS